MKSIKAHIVPEEMYFHIMKMNANTRKSVLGHILLPAVLLSMFIDEHSMISMDKSEYKRKAILEYICHLVE